MTDMSVDQTIHLDVPNDKFSIERTLGLLSKIQLKEHHDLQILDHSKIVFDEVIHLVDSGTVDAYCKNISSMFDWMRDIELPEQPTILDIGANNGLFSLAYASMYKDAQVHCFEPVSFIFDELTKNLHMNPHLSTDVHAHNFGLSNKTEALQLSIPAPEQHDRYQRINQKNLLDTRLFSVLGKGKKKYDAQFIPLDVWVDEQKITAVDFIKIDVEGYEYPVLEGALNTLRLFRPVVMFELNELTLTLSEHSTDEYLRFAKELDYDVYGLQYGFRKDLLKVTSNEQISLVSDIILKPKVE
jgi:FkbM family methyltransferase